MLKLKLAISAIMSSPKSFVAFLRNPISLAVVGLGAALFMLEADNYWKTLPFSMIVAATLVALLVLASKRVVFSFYASLILIGLLTVVSFIKFKLKGFSLHFYDIVFSGGDLKAMQFLVSSYYYFIVPVFLAIVAMIAVAVFLFRNDRRLEVSRTRLAAFTIFPVLIMPFTYPSEASVERYFYYLQGRHTTAFFVSLLDFEYLFTKGKLEKRLATVADQKPFLPTVQCQPAGASPDVFIVLSESQANPADIPQVTLSKELTNHFARANGPMQPLQVETFGGGTWITNLSLLTGLSATSFGWRSPYLTIELQDKVRGALPEIFSNCGYRTMALLPLEYTFVNEGPFLKSIGFETIFDKSSLQAPHYHMRDKFYFDAAERIIAEHRKSDKRPIFFLIETMFAHSPYEERLLPDLKVAGEPFHEDPGVSEYLRRMVIARRDLGEFMLRRQVEVGERGSLLVDFGDHQSFATKPFVDEIAGVNALANPGSLAYRTFFTLRHVDAKGERIYETEKPVDIGFLGARILDFANLPSSPLWDDLSRLDRICDGALFGCIKQKDVDKHLASRLAGGQLELATR